MSSAPVPDYFTHRVRGIYGRTTNYGVRVREERCEKCGRTLDIREAGDE